MKALVLLVKGCLLVLAFFAGIAAHAQPGLPLWTNIYSEPSGSMASSIAIGHGSKVYVSGKSGGTNSNDDFVTIAYDATTGAALWTNRCAGAAGNFDHPVGVVVGSNDTIIVTGSTGNSPRGFLTVAYSSAGTPLWTNLQQHAPPTEAVATTADIAGNVFVTGREGAAVVTIAYSSSGATLWSRTYNAPGSPGDRAQALATDADGNLFVTGESWGGGNYDFATVAYSPIGSALWTNRASLSQSSGDYPKGIAVNKMNGNVYVVGDSALTTGVIMTVAYTGDGVPLWTNTYEGPISTWSDAIAVDHNTGNVVVIGFDNGSASTRLVTILYSGTGMPLWTNHHAGVSAYAGSFAPRGKTLTLDAAGNVFAVGRSTTGNLAIAYSPAGMPLWTNYYTGNTSSHWRAVETDNSGNVFVTGFTQNGFVTIKYAGLGSLPQPHAIPLDFQVAGAELILSWTNPAFALQSAQSIQGVFTNIPAATSPHTNNMNSSPQFFRLISN